jgi:parvulin-like peptidyl-prolyl isomerase
MAEGRLNPREQARLEEQKKNRKLRSRYILIGVVILLMVALVVFVNSKLFTDGLPALKVGDDKFSVADVNYEYRKNYMQFTQNYGSYLSIFFDTEQPLNEQECTLDPDCATWDDYFKKMAETNLVQSAALYKAAQAAGVTLSDEDRAEIDSTMSTYAMYSTYYGYSNLSGYLAAMYGAGNNETTVRRNMEREMVIDRYLKDLYDAGEYTDAEKDAYYDEHADALDKVRFMYAYLSDEDAQTKAQEIVAKAENADEEAFRAAVLEVTGSEASETSYSVSSFLSQYEEVSSRDDIVPGKTFVSAAEAGAYAVRITGIDDNRYNTVSVRHILIKAQDADEDGEISDKELEVAYNAIKAVEEEWLSGEATEESFATLATLRSEDEGSVENGGLYEGIYKGQMVSAFDEFCFAGHKKGDTDIVLGSSGAYTGYHLIYFVGEDSELYSRTLAEEELRSEAYNTALSQLTDGLEGKRTWMWRYVITG